MDEKSHSFKQDVKGSKQMVYGLFESNIRDKGLFTLDGMYQKINEVPDFAGVMLPCENPTVAAFSSHPACQDSLKFPRSTYLGERWSRLKGDKYNLFSETKLFLDNDWELSLELSYGHSRQNRSQKCGRFSHCF